MPDSDKIQYADKDSYFSKLSVWLTIIATVAVTAFLIKGNSSGLMYSLFAFLLYVVFMGISTLYLRI